MDNEKFKAILIGVTNACKRAFYDGEKNIRPTVLECATKIYIEEMKIQSQEHHDKQEVYP